MQRQQQHMLGLDPELQTKVEVRPSVWMRSILMQAAKSASREQPADGYIRVREPEGITT